MRFGDTFDQLIDHAMRAHLTPFLLGEPGIGKSAAVGAIAERLGGRMFTVACNHLAEKADLTGVRVVPDERCDGGYKQVYFPIADIADCASWARDNPREVAVLFLDELNRTSGDVTSALLSLQTTRRIGTVTLPDNVFMVCAGNDKGNVTSLDDASVSRFLLLRVEPDAETWLRVNPEANQAVATALRKHPDLVFCREMPKGQDGGDDMTSDIDDILLDGSEMRQFTTPRTITYLSEFLNSFDSLAQVGELDTASAVDSAQETALEECIHAIIGATAFADAVVLEIREEIAAGVQQASNSFRVPRPPFMDDLYAATTRADLDHVVESLSPDARSQGIVSAICEHTDRRAVIDALSNGLDSIVGDALYNLMQASRAGICDRDNLDHFKDATQAGEAIAQFI